MIIDCIADLHGHTPKLEGGDLLIVAGDLTARDLPYQHIEFGTWLAAQPYRKKIFIGGNHDGVMEEWMPMVSGDIEYLVDSGTEFEGLTIWGSPWTPWFKGVNPACKAFMKTDRKLISKWEKIPKKIDILITHGPAFGILDGIPLEDGTLYHVGSQSLYGWLNYVERRGWLNYVERPRYHIFGHIHEAYGREEYFPTYEDNMMQSINCSHVNEFYEPVNDPVRIEL